MLVLFVYTIIQFALAELCMQTKSVNCMKFSLCYQRQGSNLLYNSHTWIAEHFFFSFVWRKSSCDTELLWWLNPNLFFCLWHWECFKERVFTKILLSNLTFLLETYSLVINTTGGRQDFPKAWQVW